jgi:hypothetical protein
MKTVQLYFAVLDGPNPKTWRSYGKEFYDFMGKACAAAKPDARVVSPRLLKNYNVEISPIWSTPDNLLREKNLEAMVGVIIDAFPKTNSEADRAQKIDQLRDLVTLLNNDAERQNGATSFKRFGYSIWLLTNETADVASFRESVIDAAGTIIGVRNVNDQVLNHESLLAIHLSIYLQNVYLRLDRVAHGG